MIYLFVETPIVPKGRPRFAKGRVYTPEKTVVAEKVLEWQIHEHMRLHDIAMTELPVEVALNFFYKQSRKTKSSSSFYPRKHDIDNLCKLVLDAMNGIVYKDDKQVFRLMGEKYYGNKEGIDISVRVAVSDEE